MTVSAAYDRRACGSCGREAAISASVPQARACPRCAVRLWSSAEGRYRLNDYDGAGPAGAVHAVPGDTRLLFTAANGVNYFRGTDRRPAGRWTGSAVEAFAAATGFAALAAAGPPRQAPYRDSPEYALTDALRAALRADTLVVDVLGMRDRNVDVCLGGGPLPDARSEELAERLSRAFSARGLRVGQNVPFAAMSPVAVTCYAQTVLAASALQLHLAAWLRDPDSSPTMAELVIDVLRDATVRTVS